MYERKGSAAEGKVKLHKANNEFRNLKQQKAVYKLLYVFLTFPASCVVN